jgi:hypothetical protein
VRLRCKRVDEDSVSLEGGKCLSIDTDMHSCESNPTIAGGPFLFPPFLRTPQANTAVKGLDSDEGVLCAISLFSLFFYSFPSVIIPSFVLSTSSWKAETFSYDIRNCSKTVWSVVMSCHAKCPLAHAHGFVICMRECLWVMRTVIRRCGHQIELLSKEYAPTFQSVMIHFHHSGYNIYKGRGMPVTGRGGP